MIIYPVKMIAANLDSVRQRIAKSCEKTGRPLGDVTLVCVTKGTDISLIEDVVRLGVKDLGENRVQEAIPKARAVGGGVNWHLVGHLQTNKVKDAVKVFSLIHSVDSVRLAKEIDEEAAKAGKIQDILVQVNTSGEETKFGVDPAELFNVFKEIALCPNIDIKGLMTMAPETADPESARPFFRRLRDLMDHINTLHITHYTLHILSMGMSGDFEVAIEEGSNMVRIGRAIFGE